MSITWAIARHTIAEGVRMKIALVFLALLAMVVLGLPFSVAGDSSLTGAVQSFMQYALTATSVVLSLLTIFMSRSMADEFVNRQILMLMAKPVARWEYVLGKWLGVTLMNAAFLLASGAATYGMVHYIRDTHPPIDDIYDADSLENEVLVARHALRCKLPDFRQPAEREFQRNLEEGRYDNVFDFDPETIKADLAMKHEQRWRFVPPYERRVFEFENVLVDRSAGQEVQIRYKTDVTRPAPDEIFRALWIVGDTLKGARQTIVPVRHVVSRFHTVAFPASAVADDNTLTVEFQNRNPYEGERQEPNIIEFNRANEVEVLFIVGSFTGNFIRLLTLMMCKLMFLAAVATLMTTVFSFPVACLGSLTMYVLAGVRGFLAEALDFASDDYAQMFSSFTEFATHAIGYLMVGVYWIVPDFAAYDAVEDFVNGRNVSLVWVLRGVVWLVMVKTGVILGLAILLFHRREVAEISV